MIRFLHAVPLSSCCTFGVGGAARQLGYAYTAEDLAAAADAGALVLGRGSNVLIGDGGAEVVVVNRAAAHDFAGDSCVCESGVTMATLCRAYAQNGRTGLAWAAGLPGTLGGALIGNAGCFGGAIGDLVQEVTVRSDGRTVRLSADECGFSYRHSDIKGVVLSARLAAEPGDRIGIENEMQRVLARRRATQPNGASAGCVFKAANGVSAAKYVDDAGLKGLRVGGAEVSRVHAGFIVNTGGALAADILQLLRTVQANVYDSFGVLLEPEIKRIGEFW